MSIKTWHGGEREGGASFRNQGNGGLTTCNGTAVASRNARRDQIQHVLTSPVNGDSSSRHFCAVAVSFIAVREREEHSRGTERSSCQDLRRNLPAKNYMRGLLQAKFMSRQAEHHSRLDVASRTQGSLLGCRGERMPGQTSKHRRVAWVLAHRTCSSSCAQQPHIIHRSPVASPKRVVSLLACIPGRASVSAFRRSVRGAKRLVAMYPEGSRKSTCERAKQIAKGPVPAHFPLQTCR
ncbi:hypothetical protein IE81DRAFT_206042 [Ceraceosorus guamensis]|uniref:Uncharacterized protein n=1 Tax=Ceraceosorus guamensis TaxID=1522189 RepID=A0A316VSV7_9BASI|nr:hypothetical protein IE81DRAFT_206042 [Ceraceosorus guamensis]PWN40719.1 hypothetical protein IE81DRAFT_206042 [Ceraceosorus guamensis]